MYYITLIISMCFYPLGIYLYNKKLYWESTYAHSMVHIISNISNIILYTGAIVPFTQNYEYFIPIINILSNNNCNLESNTNTNTITITNTNTYN